MHPSRFMTDSLRNSAAGESITRVLSAALRSVEPGQAIASFMKRTSWVDTAKTPAHRSILTIGERTYPLEEIQRIYLIGAGKAAAPMVKKAAEILGDRLTNGIVITKDSHARGVHLPKTISIFEAGHPLPDQRGIQATQSIQNLLKEIRPNDLVVCLISGGGSALMVSPEEGLNLADLQALTTGLLASGANINEINTLRKHLDQVKGGKLARLAFPAQVATLILSDVVGDSLDVIASGPTVPDPTTYEYAFRILAQYKMIDRIPVSILRHLQQGREGIIPETSKPGEILFENVNNIVIGSNLLAAQAAGRQADAEGFHVLLLSTYLQGEASQAGRFLAAIGKQIANSGIPLPRPACLIIGGETTVTLQGDGLGGRNQEMALSAVTDLAGLPDMDLVTLATDGGDGPTDAAGAVVTGDTLARARLLGLDPQNFLARNDAYHFFEALGDLIKTGPTQTNVNDLAFLFAF